MARFRRHQIGDRWKNIGEFSALVTKLEGKRKSVNIGQVKEILKITNDLLDGDLYFVIRDHINY